MTPTQFRACLDTLDWSQRSLARLLDRDERMVRRWASGQCTIPEDVAEWLTTLAAFHAKHPVPLFDRRPGSRTQESYR
jgi:ribosome-binding protein aMBF1 (putative translation factor)